MKSEELILGDLHFKSRLLMGTGKYSSTATMLAAIKTSECEIVTVALRRFNPERADDDLTGPLMSLKNVTLMPNTSGAKNAREAVKAACAAREICGSRLIKLEIHPNPQHLLPDPIETYEAAGLLVKEGFLVMPYMPADPVLAQKLEDIGCVSVMPLGSAIGSGHGLATFEMLRIIIRNSAIPVIVDAGIRAPSEAAAAMEAGCAAVLVNSAVAAADDPPAMANAFAQAVNAGYRARLAGIMSRRATATATSPLTAFLDR